MVIFYKFKGNQPHSRWSINPIYKLNKQRAIAVIRFSLLFLKKLIIKKQIIDMTPIIGGMAIIISVPNSYLLRSIVTANIHDITALIIIDTV